MAPITWRNVEAPDFRTALLGLNQAQQAFQGALTPIAEALKQREATADANWLNERNNNANDFRAELMSQFRTPEAYQAGLADGSVQALLGRYQNIDKRPALDLIDSRLGALQQRATADIMYRNTVRDDLLRPNIQAAKAAAARNDPLTYYAATGREGMENYVGDLALLLEAGRRGDEQDARLAAGELRAGNADSRAAREMEIREQMLPAELRYKNALAASAEAEAAYKANGGDAAAQMEKELRGRQQKAAEAALASSPIANDYLGTPKGNDYVRGGIQKMFPKNESAQKAAFQLLEKYKGGVTVEKDGKKTTYKVPAGTMLELIEQNMGKFQGDDSLWPWKGSDIAAVGTLLEKRFQDNNFMSAYADGERARTLLTDMDNLGFNGSSSIPSRGRAGAGGAGTGSGSGGGTSLAPLNQTNRGTPTVPGKAGGKGDPAPGSGIVSPQEMQRDSMDGTAEDIAELRRELSNARNPEARQALQGELDRKLREGIKPTPDNSTEAIARDVAANMLLRGSDAGAVAAAPTPSGSPAAAAPAAPVRVSAASTAPTPAQTRDALMARLVQVEQANGQLSPESQAWVNQQRQAQSAEDLKALRSAGNAVKDTLATSGYGLVDGVTLLPRLAARGVIQGANLVNRGINALGGNLPAVDTPDALRTVSPLADAYERRKNAPAVQQSAAEQRVALAQEFRSAGLTPPGSLARVSGGPVTDENGKRLIPAVSTTGETVGKAPQLQATALNPTPSKVSASTSFSVAPDGSVQDAAPVTIPREVKFDKPETVVEAKKTAKDFQGKANTAVITYVEDGDTVKMDNGLTCRIDTIDAQETAKTKFNPRKTGQPYGEQAKREMMDLVQGKEVTVRITQPTPDDGGRYYCQISVEGQDVDLAMVQRGAAELYREFVVDKRLGPIEQAKRLAKSAILGPAEAAARASGAGQWSLPNYERPSEYRRRTE